MDHRKDYVGGLYDDATNPRWRTAAILDVDFGP